MKQEEETSSPGSEGAQDTAAETSVETDAIRGEIEELRRELGELRQGPVGSIDAGTGSTQQATLLTRAALAAMSPQEIKQLDWQEVRRVLSGR